MVNKLIKKRYDKSMHARQMLKTQQYSIYYFLKEPSDMSLLMLSGES